MLEDDRKKYAMGTHEEKPEEKLEKKPEDKKEKKDDTEKLKGDVAKKDDEIAILKQKVDMEKNKAINVINLMILLFDLIHII